MEKFDERYNELNPYELYHKVKEIINGRIDSCTTAQLKLDKTNTIINIFDRLEEYLNSNNPKDSYFIEENLGLYFSDLISELPGNYLLDLESELKVKIIDLVEELNPEVEEIKSTAEELICSTIEKVLKSGNLQFSTKLDRTQIEYLVRNPSEYNNFISILETIGRIKMLPTVNGKNLSIQHLTASINHFKVGFTGRMTATKNENTKKYINLSNCVETNLSGGDRFIFSLENIVDNNGNNQTLINVKVLGKPPYKHD